jgi:hypothetical protein
MAIIDDQFARCKAAVERLEALIEESHTGETTLPIAVHEVHDLEVFLENAGRMIDVARHLGDVRLELLTRIERAEAVLQCLSARLSEYQAQS